MIADRPSLTFTFLSECFHLDERNGVLIWKNRPSHHFANASAWRSFNTLRPGKEAGTIKTRHTGSRKVVQVAGEFVFVHRVVYALHQGLDMNDVPSILDHIDCDSLNNRPSNLRPATPTENTYNRIRHHNTSGLRGVSYQEGAGTWRAKIKHHGSEVNLGIFLTKEEAAAAYIGAAKIIHGEFYRQPRNQAAG